MKDLEGRTRYMLPRRCYTLIRIDGKSFHTYTKGLKKPFDMDLIEDMQKTTLKLCKETGAKIGYVQSDEISLVLTDFKENGTQSWFDNNLQKVCSVTASIATAEFNLARFSRNGLSEKTAHFDTRVWTVSDPWDVYNTFLWRQKDASKNSIQMVARSLASHKECTNKNEKMLQELIFSKGQNWNDYPTICKRGTFVYKTDEEWIVDLEAPILTQDKKWFFDKLPMIEQPSF